MKTNPLKNVDNIWDVRFEGEIHSDYSQKGSINNPRSFAETPGDIKEDFSDRIEDQIWIHEQKLDWLRTIKKNLDKGFSNIEYFTSASIKLDDIHTLTIQKKRK